jgi:hypothetical protein
MFDIMFASAVTARHIMRQRLEDSDLRPARPRPARQIILEARARAHATRHRG